VLRNGIGCSGGKIEDPRCVYYEGIPIKWFLSGSQLRTIKICNYESDSFKLWELYVEISSDVPPIPL